MKSRPSRQESQLPYLWLTLHGYATAQRTTALRDYISWLATVKF